MTAMDAEEGSPQMTREKTKLGLLMIEIIADRFQSLLLKALDTQQGSLQMVKEDRE
jgi:hypothetical protein